MIPPLVRAVRAIHFGRPPAPCKHLCMVVRAQRRGAAPHSGAARTLALGFARDPL